MLIVVVERVQQLQLQHHHQPVVTSVPHQPHVVTNKHANVNHVMVVELHLLLQLQVPEVDLEDQRKEGFGVVRLVQNNAIAHPGHRISVVFILHRVWIQTADFLMILQYMQQRKNAMKRAVRRLVMRVGLVWK